MSLLDRIDLVQPPAFEKHFIKRPLVLRITTESNSHTYLLLHACENEEVEWSDGERGRIMMLER